MFVFCPTSFKDTLFSGKFANYCIGGIRSFVSHLVSVDFFEGFLTVALCNIKKFQIIIIFPFQSHLETMPRGIEETRTKANICIAFLLCLMYILSGSYWHWLLLSLQLWQMSLPYIRWNIPNWPAKTHFVLNLFMPITSTWTHAPARVGGKVQRWGEGKDASFRGSTGLIWPQICTISLVKENYFTFSVLYYD